MPDNIAGQTRTVSVDQGTPGFQAGRIVYDATSITAADTTRVVVGFKPRYVRWVNLTDRVEVEWFEGMAANTSLKTAAAGTRTLETTNGGITVDDKGFRVSQNATLAAILASKTCTWQAQG
jgi:ABC-type taurine transport system ATPase subunit